MHSFTIFRILNGRRNWLHYTGSWTIQDFENYILSQGEGLYEAIIDDNIYDTVFVTVNNGKLDYYTNNEE